MNQTLARTNNFFAQNICHSAEQHLIEGLILLKAVQSQNSNNIDGKEFNKILKIERAKIRYFGSLENEIKKLVRKSDPNIIKENFPYYSFLKNYVILRNCFTHRAGIITSKEKDLEIRLPYLSQEQIEKALKEKSCDKLILQTVLRTWKLEEQIELNIKEVEGIAYGILKTIFQIFSHLYKAADKHLEKLERNNDTQQRV